jgi:hypothetical protein
MSVLSVVVWLLGTLELATHWAPLRWAEYALGLTIQAGLLLAWWGARGAPVAVVWSCPYCGGVLGDRVAVQVHIERQHAPADLRAKGVMG